MDIIKQHDKDMVKNLKIIKESFKESDEQRIARETKNKADMDKLRREKSRREYNEICMPKAKAGPLGIGSLSNEFNAFQNQSLSAQG